MSGFVYWIPNKRRSITVSELVDLGLDYVFDTAPRCCETRRGPVETAGVAIAEASSRGRVGYYPDAQVWRQVPNSEVWIGFEPGSKPTPAELVRSAILTGDAVTLGDGNDWMIPLVRTFADDDEMTGISPIPARYDLAEDGAWERVGPMIEHQELFERGEAYWAAMIAGVRFLIDDDDEAGDDDDVETVEFEYADQVSTAVLALRTNYRVSDVEVAALDLLNDNTTSKLLNALVDFPGFLVRLKKNAARDGISTGGG